MRIYEIAREIGVTSVEVLKAAEAAGMEATSAEALRKAQSRG